MLRLSIRNLLVSKLRLFLTVAAVTVGVSFVSGTFVLSDTMAKAFDELYVGLTSGTDVVVRSEAAFEGDIATNGGQLRPIDESMVDEVRAVPGVAFARGAVTGFALILDKDGQPIQPGGAPTFGASIGDTRLSGDFVYRQGIEPTRADQVAIDARTAERAGFQLGDRIDVVLQGGRQTFTLVGIIGFGESDSLLGATMAGFDLTTAQRLFDKVGVLDEVDVQAEPGLSAGELRDRIAAILPDGVEALTGDQVAADGSAAVRDAMGVFTTVLLVFAGISVLVGSFVIWNTFNVLVAQRRREVALLRAVGATRGQVLRGVLLEATLVGTFSAGLGLLLGVGLAAGIRALLTLIGVEMPTTSPAVETRTVVAALLVGVLVTLAAAIAPAWAATRVSPMEALRDAVPTRYEVGPSRAISRLDPVVNRRHRPGRLCSRGQPAVVDGAGDLGHVRRTRRRGTHAGSRHGPPRGPRPARGRVADGRTQHRAQRPPLGRHRPGPHDRTDRRGRGRSERRLAPGFGGGRGERWQPVGPHPRACRSRPWREPFRG